MSHELSRPARRVGVIAQYSSVALFASAFLVGEYTAWSTSLVVVACVALVALVLSCYRTLIRTDLWRLTHARVDQLDEREIEATHTSLRRSYAIFTGITLTFITWMLISVRFSFLTLTHRGHYSFGLIALICLQFLVQTLPASIMAWTEKRVALR